MKTWHPNTLIQVHYHNLPGGVSAVISRYASAFAELTKTEICNNVVVCNSHRVSGMSFAPAKTIHVPSCDYRAFTTVRSFTTARRILIDSLISILEKAKALGPVCVVGHNLSLAKNTALAAAFADCAHRYSDVSDSIRFFSVIHDFAEDGRIRCMEQIAFLTRAGIDIHHRRYAAGGIHYVSVNQSNSRIIQEAGGTCTVLPNPLSFSGTISAKEKEKHRKALFTFAQRKKTSFDELSPVVLYPSRIIARKNSIEAVLLAALVYKCNLVLGTPGNNVIHSGILTGLTLLCKQHKLPVLFNCLQAFELKPDSDGFPREAYACADMCLSTSLTEGFGYALYEPWLYGRAVIGRKPLNFITEADILIPELYQRLPVPASWISLTQLTQHYYKAMVDCFGETMVTQQCGNFTVFERTMNTMFIKSETIDFGCLGSSTQLEILGRLLQSEQARQTWESVCKDDLITVKKSFLSAGNTATVIAANQNKIQRLLSGKPFTKNFRNCFMSCKPQVSPPIDATVIARHFCNIARFRLLLD